MAIYIVRNAEGTILRYVRAKSAFAAIKGHIEENFTAKRASSEEMYEGFKNGFEVLDMEMSIEETDDEQ